MKVEVLHFEGCPNHRPAVRRVRELLKEMGLKAEVVEVNVPDEATARRVRFLGSPTIRINGLDVEPPARSSTQFGMMCRTYSEGGRRQGIPSRELIRQALKAAHISGEEFRYGEVIMEEKNGRKEKMLTGGVVLAAVAASLCCTIPLFFAGAGVTAIIVAEQFAAVRPYLLGVTGLMLTAGFYYAYRRKSCEPGGVCATPEGRRRVRLGLWLASAVAVVLTTIPYWSPAVVRGIAQTSQASASGPQIATVPVQKTTLQISGMICEMCAAVMEQELNKQAGIRSARVRFSESKAEIEYDSAQITLPQIRSLIGKAGYQVVAAADGQSKG